MFEARGAARGPPPKLPAQAASPPIRDRRPLAADAADHAADADADADAAADATAHATP